MKALLLAPAETPGLDPLAYATPAPLLPLLGEPLVAPLLRRLAAGGVVEAVLACPSRGAAYERCLLDGRSFGLNLAILELGAAASVRSAVEAVRALGFHDQTMAVLPANSWTDANWRDLESLHVKSGGGASTVAAEGAPSGILLADPGACVSDERTRTISAGFRWRNVTSWSEYGALAREAMTEPELGIAPRYARVEAGACLAPLARLDRKGAHVEGAVWLGPGACVDAGAVLRGPLWIGANCRIGPGVTLERCYIEAGARLHGPLDLRDTLVVANRAIALDHASVTILDEDHPADASDGAMTRDLLQLATRTARRTAPVLQARL